MLYLERILILFRSVPAIMIVGTFLFSSAGHSQSLCAEAFKLHSSKNLVQVLKHLRMHRTPEEIVEPNGEGLFTRALSLDEDLKNAFEILGFDFLGSPIRVPTLEKLIENYVNHFKAYSTDEILFPALTFRHSKTGEIFYYTPGLDSLPEDSSELFSGQLTHDEFVAGLSKGRFPLNYLGLHDVSHLAGYIQQPRTYMKNLLEAFRTRSHLESTERQENGEYFQLHFMAELLSHPKSEKIKDIEGFVGFAVQNTPSVEEVIDQYSSQSVGSILEMVNGILDRSMPLIWNLGGIVAHPPEENRNAQYIGNQILNETLGDSIFLNQRKTGDEMAYNSISFMPFEIDYLAQLFSMPDESFDAYFRGYGVTKKLVYEQLVETLARFHWSLWFGAKFVSIEGLMRASLFEGFSNSGNEEQYIRGLRGDRGRLYQVILNNQ